jgi:hypothetical protein
MTAIRFRPTLNLLMLSLLLGTPDVRAGDNPAISVYFPGYRYQKNMPLALYGTAPRIRVQIISRRLKIPWNQTFSRRVSIW